MPGSARDSNGESECLIHSRSRYKGGSSRPARMGKPGTAAMTSSDLTRSIMGHTMGDLYPLLVGVTPVVLTAKSPA